MNRGLATAFPHVYCELDFTCALELTVATILSAQSTDKRINLTTPALFAKYRTARDYAEANRAELEELIRPTGFYRNKANSLIRLGQELVERFGGEVPRTMEELVTLPGVGRKTANVVLNTAFGEPTMAVDTHIFRVANRTGLAPGRTPLAVEKKLLRAVPAAYLMDAHHWLILHGRYICKARKPDCPACPIADLCAFKRKTRATDPCAEPR